MRSLMKSTMQTTNSTDDCRTLTNQLFELWLGESDEPDSSDLLDHLSQCPACLKRWITLQAAGQLASHKFRSAAIPTGRA